MLRVSRAGTAHRDVQFHGKLADNLQAREMAVQDARHQDGPRPASSLPALWCREEITKKRPQDDKFDGTECGDITDADYQTRKGQVRTCLQPRPVPRCRAPVYMLVLLGRSKR